MKKAVTDMRYTFIIGVIRAMEARLLTTDFFSKLIKANSLEGAYDLLKGTEYSEFISSDIDSIENIMKGKNQWLFDFIEKYSFHHHISSLLRLEYDYHNCRILLKEKIFEIELSDNLLDYGTIDKKTIISIFEKEEYFLFSEIMERSLVDAVEKYYETKNSLVIDLILDRGLMMDLLKISENLNSPIIIDFYKGKIDCFNFQILSRLQGKVSKNIRDLLFMRGGSIEESQFIDLIESTLDDAISLAFRYDLSLIMEALKAFSSERFALEKATDTYLKSILHQTQYSIFGVEPFFAFGQYVNMELKNLQLIIGALKSGAEAEWIEKRISK